MAKGVNTKSVIKEGELGSNNNLPHYVTSRSKNLVTKSISRDKEGHFMMMKNDF